MQHSFKHRDFNTWYTIHNDGNILWIIFEYECVILSRQWTPDVTKSHVTKPNSKSNDNSVNTAGKQEEKN